MGSDDAALGNYPTTRTALVVERMADSPGWAPGCRKPAWVR
jgi:hypothetical protein